MCGTYIWRRGWDSNPRYPEGTTVFETVPFGHSGTPPRDDHVDRAAAASIAQGLVSDKSRVIFGNRRDAQNLRYNY